MRRARLVYCKPRYGNCVSAGRGDGIQMELHYVDDGEESEKLCIDSYIIRLRNEGASSTHWKLLIKYENLKKLLNNSYMCIS